ncbi:MAG: putative molybdenum carrier protein, partial [Planctomycetota bacterium]
MTSDVERPLARRITIVSGGQTGADRAALDFAIAADLPHGGWCPRGRRAEDGPIADKYRLRETPSDSYRQRTEWNVRDSDATAIFTLECEMRGGTKLTAEIAARLDKPLCVLCAERQT